MKRILALVLVATSLAFAAVAHAGVFDGTTGPTR